MIKTILVDDEPRGINTLKKILELYCPDVQVIASCNDADSAKDKIEQLQPDLVFLDIAMPGKTSLAMLSELNAISLTVITDELIQSLEVPRNKEVLRQWIGKTVKDVLELHSKGENS